MPPPTFQAPTGTRDLYPLDAAKRRYITEAWRTVSIRHGFEEIDGPTFEHLDLYTVKSGEGIVNELFSFRRAGGEKDFALRPEFTPTLARMYAARAGQLPKPTKWFTAGPFFRAERPQRGRLREFLQWNADVLGDDSPMADAEAIACCLSFLESVGLSPKDCQVKLSHRGVVEDLALASGMGGDLLPKFFTYLDGEAKRSRDENSKLLESLGIPIDARDKFVGQVEQAFKLDADGTFSEAKAGLKSERFDQLEALARNLYAMGFAPWINLDLRVVRGLAYYTGVVFEVIADGERAIAGGGRYDGLVQLFGGPPTPAVGFGMGDVVVSLLLQDKGLMPDGTDLLRRVGAAPDLFVISNGSELADAALTPTVSILRRAGLHVRRSAKATKNIGKLLQDADKCGARFAAILENDRVCTLKDLASGQQRTPVAIDELVELLRA